MSDDTQTGDPEPAANPDGSVTVDLESPIHAHGEEFRQLTLRKPTPRDLKRCGYPFKFGEDGHTFVPGPVNALISQLAGIPASSVEQISLADWNDCAMALMGFFQPKAPPGS